MFEAADWRWYGHPGHLIVGQDCRFHLATEIGNYLVSTVGEYLPDSNVREIMAASRGITLDGMGDARRADFMRKIGFQEIGSGRKYETMVFEIGTDPKRCSDPECGCGIPHPTTYSELDFEGYNDAGSATRGHYAMCQAWAAKP